MVSCGTSVALPPSWHCVGASVGWSKSRKVLPNGGMSLPVSSIDKATVSVYAYNYSKCFEMLLAVLRIYSILYR